MSQKENKEDQNTPPPTLVEWAIRGFCLVLVGGLLSYFLYCGMQPKSSPSFKIDIASSEIKSHEGLWSVPVSITNEGDAGVSQLNVQSIQSGESSPKTKELSIPLLGGRERIKTEFWFDEKPDLEVLKFRVISYTLP